MKESKTIATPDSVKRAYDAIADEWHKFRKDCAINKCVAEFEQLLPRNSEILDVGCGTGYPIAAYLTEKGHRVTGIDVSTEMLEKARALKLVNARFINVDFTDYVADTSFDAVIAFDSLWHIARSAQEEIYLKLASLIKSGGYLLFTHGSRKGEITGEMYGETFYYSALDAARARELLAENGFEILTFMGNYSEPTTGTRDLLVTARKKNQSS